MENNDTHNPEIHDGGPVWRQNGYEQFWDRNLPVGPEQLSDHGLTLEQLSFKLTGMHLEELQQVCSRSVTPSTYHPDPSKSVSVFISSASEQIGARQVEQRIFQETGQGIGIDPAIEARNLSSVKPGDMAVARTAPAR